MCHHVTVASLCAIVVAGGALVVVQELVQTVVDANALWDREDGSTLLHSGALCTECYVSCVSNARWRAGPAAFNGQVHVAAYLLEQGAEVDCPMSNGATPIL